VTVLGQPEAGRAGAVPAPSMRLSALLVCDHAQVREGLVFVCGGAIPAFAFPSFPGRLSACCVAVVLELGAGAAGAEHPLEVYLHDERGDAVLSTARNVIAVPSQAEAGWLVPRVADFSGAEIPAPGRYCVTVAVDEMLLGQVGFSAVVVGQG